ncbi:MAG: hypothetical protein J7500_09745 [Sphingomonas sp.]|uniref:hypothetical protein n=1 Tax=Sphingomonas sp. TaxID=28214 RepID=UPI001B0F7287|nr:hypothetical protein [Sphingomonas sp.]MBO9622981.1 hypothetical protein [Sphingomonas sp.]
MSGTVRQQRGGTRLALLLVACALLFRVAVPAGWMPQLGTQGLSLNWCSESGMGAPAEAHALLAKALGDKPDPVHKAPDQPCAFAAAAQPLASAEQPQLPLPRARPEPVPPVVLTALPGRGLAAPPPLSTGPPHLA